MAKRLVRLLCLAASAWAVGAEAEDPACKDPDYKHGISYLLPLKYDKHFTHFDWANPDAPKSGAMRLPSLGTFDSYNNILEKGRMAAGYDRGGGLVYDKLMEGAADEPVSNYGRLAEGVATGPNLDWIAFKLRDTARWHDDMPITVDDVVFSFEMFLEHGSVALRTSLADLERVFAFGEREVCFVRNTEIEVNPALPFAIGGQAILPKHYWEQRDITKTTVEPPLGSGPYRLKRVETGRLLEFELDE
ncbi:MAG: ABC transporter substrate-binding protein, partial [Gammaproteobacteria bacterium]|nr:ABC transporter substrate-binding protein [Gammaproteobacteria bacterium]